MYEELVKDLREKAEFLTAAEPLGIKNAFAETMTQAADAIDELQKHIDVEKAFSDAWEENANECRVRFQKLLDAFPKWIKANGNPTNNNGQQFLVYIVYPNGSGEVTLGEYWDKCDDQKDFGWGTKGGGVVTHYMPLPEPPKETTDG